MQLFGGRAFQHYREFSFPGVMRNIPRAVGPRRQGSCIDTLPVRPLLAGRNTAGGKALSHCRAVYPDLFELILPMKYKK